MNTYSVEIVDTATGGADVYSMTIETARTHIDAARDAVRTLDIPDPEAMDAFGLITPESPEGGDQSSRSRDRFYSAGEYEITVWKHV